MLTATKKNDTNDETENLKNVDPASLFFFAAYSGANLNKSSVSLLPTKNMMNSAH